MAGVTELGYIGIGVSDVDAWKAYATEVIGMEVLDEGLADRFFLRLDSFHHRLAVHNSGEDDLLYLGWRTAGRAEFEAMKETLRAADIPFREGSKAEAEERHVLGVLKLTDPGGIGTEIYYGPEVMMHRPFHPGRPLHGRFSTGSGGAGHCIVTQPDSEAAYRFYSALGLEGGVEVKVAPPVAPFDVELTFMHCNERQHSIAWSAPPTAAKKINHLMIEYQDLTDLGMSHDIVQQRKIPVAMSLGVHSNDRMLSFYSANPSGWLTELGAPIGQTHATQSEHYRSDIFGHQVARAEFFADN